MVRAPGRDLELASSDEGAHGGGGAEAEVAGYVGGREEIVEGDGVAVLHAWRVEEAWGYGNLLR